MNTIGYCRVSTTTQNIERQERNILKEYPEAIIFKESITGTTLDRPNYIAVKRLAKDGDRIVFDSVSRMSRNAEEGYNDYMELWEKGIELIFLNEPYLNTLVFQQQERNIESLKVEGEEIQPLIKGIQEYLKNIIRKQIKIGFEQAEKEVKDLQKRTKEGLATAALNGVKLGRPFKKINPFIRKDIIENYLNSRGKTATDLAEEYKVSKNTIHNWVRQIRKELEDEKQD